MKELKNQELKKSFLDCIERLARASSKFPWDNKNAYGNWLAQTYYFVRHTTCFLAIASSRFGHWQRERQYYLLGHIREEMEHDKVALEDLKNLGFELTDFPELPETSAFYQSQYYYIEHENPIALFGYSLCLEGLAAKKGALIYKVVEKIYSKETTRFLHLHSVVDKDHFETGLEFFNGVTSFEADFILKNLEQSCSLYLHILDHITSLASSQNVTPLKKSA
jgi:hypothetical protein